MNNGRKANGKRARARTGLVAALDVGTTKICCLIGRATGQGLRVIGMGHQASKGVRAGGFIDLEAVEAAIRATVEAAESMAKENIDDVTVNVSAGIPRSRAIPHEISVAGHVIGDADLRRVVEAASVLDDASYGQEIVHAIPVGYTVDGCRGIRDPRGMYGQRLGVTLHVITAASGALRTFATGVARCHLDIADKVVTPYASALGCLVEDETQLGVTLIEMGGGTTSVAVFFDGELVFTDIIPIGGMHVTSDIAQGLSTPMAQAERIKTLFGNCVASATDDRQPIEVMPVAGEPGAEYAQVPRSMLVNIIRPRIEETFELVRSRLEAARMDRLGIRRAVLTGGASQLAGVMDLAGTVLDKQVRLGRPRAIDGLPEAAMGPAFSTSVGLLQYAARRMPEMSGHLYRPTSEPAGRWARLGTWLRENF